MNGQDKKSQPLRVGIRLKICECPPPFSESVVTPFLAVDLAYQEILNHSCATAPDLHRFRL